MQTIGLKLSLGSICVGWTQEHSRSSLMGTSWARTVGDVSPESTRKGENGNLSQTAGKTVEEMVKGQVVTYAGCVCMCVCVRELSHNVLYVRIKGLAF